MRHEAKVKNYAAMKDVLIKPTK